MKSEIRNPKSEGWPQREFWRPDRNRSVRVSKATAGAPLLFPFSPFLLFAVLGVCLLVLPSRSAASPVTRELFNAGTRQLQTNQLREAEVQLVSTLAQQDERLQPAALYNLGHVRFAQGVEALKKSPDAARTTQRARSAAARSEAAVRQADAALAGNDIQQMVAAYQQGRGARRELREAEKAVRQAIEAHAATLLRWQRALGDFQSAAELNPANTNATHNAEVVKRHIAKLIDQLRQMQQMMGGTGGTGQQLKEKMQALRGRIPDPDMPPGAPGDEEEDEDMPGGPKPGQEEGPSRSGEEQAPMSPEDAGRMLDGFRLDGERRLPMGGDQEGKPVNPNQRNW
jgi:tetratricopeptide (TPR) repeat protein